MQIAAIPLKTAAANRASAAELHSMSKYHVQVMEVPS